MHLWAKYGTQTDIRFAMVKRGVVDLAATGDWTPATGDTKLSKDGGSYANSANNPAAVAGTGSIGWKLTLSATELQCAELNVQVVDSATKSVEDQFLTIYTYGNASAKIQADLSDAVRLGLTALPNANAEAAGGLYTRGSGAGQINQQANGQVDANVARWLNTAAATPNTAGKPLVDLDLWKGSAPNALSSSRVDVSVGAMAANVLTATAINADAITATKLASDVGAEIADAVWDEATSGHTTAGTTGKALTDAGAGGSPPSAADVADAVWDEALSGHTTSGSSGERLGRLPNVAAGGNGGVVLADANGRAKVDVERWLTGTPNALQSGRIDSYVGAMASAVIAAASFASGALDAVWSTATRVLTAGTNIALAKGTGVTGFNDLDAAGVRTAVGLAGANLDTQLNALPTAAENADAVWDEALSGHLSAGSTGEALDAAASSTIAGPGALTKTISVSAGGDPLQGASVWLATDAAGTNVIAGPLATDSFGVVTVLVDAGTYYVWARKDGFEAILGESIAVS